MVNASPIFEREIKPNFSDIEQARCHLLSNLLSKGARASEKKLNKTFGKVPSNNYADILREGCKKIQNVNFSK